MVTRADLERIARLHEQAQADAAYTRCAAEEIRLRRLLAERAVDVVDELQGDLSYAEARMAQRAKVAA